MSRDPEEEGKQVREHQGEEQSRRGHRTCKGPGAGLGLACWRRARRPVYLEQNEQQGERGEGRIGRPPSPTGHAGPWGSGKNLSFYPEGGGALEYWGQRRVGPGSGAHRWPLVAAAEKTDAEG